MTDTTTYLIEMTPAQELLFARTVNALVTAGFKIEDAEKLGKARVLEQAMKDARK